MPIGAKAAVVQQKYPASWSIAFKKFFHGLLQEGVYIAPSAYETWFITDALSYEDLDFTIHAIAEVAKEL